MCCALPLSGEASRVCAGAGDGALAAVPGAEREDRLQAIGEARIALQKYRDDAKNGVTELGVVAAPVQAKSAKLAWVWRLR